MTLSSNLIVVAALMAGQATGDQRPAPANELKLPKTMVSLIDQLILPARMAGVIQQLILEDGTKVQEGLVIKSGQLLGNLDNEDAVARQRAAESEHRVAMAEESKAKANIAASQATVGVASAEVAASEQIRKGSPAAVSEQELRRQKLTVIRAQSEHEVAQKEQETAVLTIEAKKAQLDVAGITVKHHRIESTMDGIIVQMFRRPGEWVNPGDPIMKIVYMDKLRVEGFVNADEYTPDEIMGKAVEVLATLPQGRTPERFQAVIAYVSPVVEASGEYRVWCEVENRQHNGHWILRPGMITEMTIKLDSQPNKVASKN